MGVRAVKNSNCCTCPAASVHRSLDPRVHPVLRGIIAELVCVCCALVIAVEPSDTRPRDLSIDTIVFAFAAVWTHSR